jgi:allantoinase
MVAVNIINGLVFSEQKLVKKSISIDKGKIVFLGSATSLPKAERTIDASKKVILPGAIDVHTHILDLVFSYRDDFLTGTQGAASGGVTTFLEMPLGLKNKTALESFDRQLQAMQKKCLVDFALIGSAGRSTIDAIPLLARKGAVAFKTFLLNASDEEWELKDLAAGDDYSLLRLFSAIAKTGLVSCVHAENDAIISQTMRQLQAEGRTDFSAHTASRPPIAEDEAAMRAMVLANRAQTKLHLVHMSSKQSFENIKLAKTRGWDVTCEITPHHLFFTDQEAAKIGPWLKVNPPIRSAVHQQAAWQALNDGIIDFVASDHSPYSLAEKDLTAKENNIFAIGSGTPGLETMFPVMLDAVNKSKLPLARLVEVLATGPAKRFGLFPRKGTIAVGSDADLVIVDMNKECTLKSENMYTKSKITVFDGRTVKGKIEQTLVRGKVIFANDTITAEAGYGQFISPVKEG